jgi:type VI secretion system protein
MSGLLSRINSLERGAGKRSENLTESIADHLRVLLNARQGDAATAAAFGLADFHALVHLPQSPQALAASIRSSILAYEPRLKNVAVRHVEGGDPLSLRFEISAAVVDKSTREVLRFETRVSPGGHVELT